MDQQQKICLCVSLAHFHFKKNSKIVSFNKPRMSFQTLIFFKNIKSFVYHKKLKRVKVVLNTHKATKNKRSILINSSFQGNLDVF